jgi:hypothetical protein
MMAVLNLAALLVTTILAVAGAVVLHWLFLQATFLLMRPATARRIAVRSELVRGTAQLARAFSGSR